MPRFFRLTKIRHTAKSVSSITKVLSSKKSWRAFLVVAIIGVSFSYLVTVISVSTQGYEMRDLENKIAELKLENKKLNLQVAGSQSLTRIEEWVAESDMVLASDVQYISSTTGVVATR